MAVLLPTTTITILREPDTIDTIDRGNSFQPVYTGIRAAVEHTKSASHTDSGSYVDHRVLLTADPCDLRDGDRVIDELTGEEYNVEGAVTRTNLIIPATIATLVRVERIR